MIAKRVLTIPESRYSDFKWKEYVYRKPVIPELNPNSCINKYEGKSLEEIRIKYGDEDAKMVYTCICAGLGDLTKPRPPVMEDFKFTYKADIEIDYGLDEINIYLLPWRKGLERRRIGHCRVGHTDDELMHMVSRWVQYS